MSRFSSLAPGEPDPLDHPDPARVADAAAVEGLLRCYVREAGVPVPLAGPLLLELPATGLRLEVPVRYRSVTGWHRFGPARLASGAPADAALVAAALAREACTRLGLDPHAGTGAVARVLDSARRVAAHVAARRARPDDPPGVSPFLAGEQALLLGHPFHPTPKSREEASDAELAEYSPELRGAFPLHWFAAHRSVVAGDSAGPPVADLARELAGAGLRPPPDTVPVPAHPWQAREVRRRPGVRALLEAGLLHDLGPAGPAWHPTSSVRTVYRADAPYMLKLSLGLRITNSRRNNLRSELDLGVRVARLLAAGLADRLAAAHPAFRIVRDLAWISVDAPGEAPESGLETAIRENPFGPGERVVCVSGLVAERPGLGPSRLGETVRALAARSGRGLDEVSAEWFDRYLRVVAIPLLWLYAEHGLALEAHQQNTLVTLDVDGWPTGGWYRDSQGYYVAASKVGRVRALLPGFDEGVPVVFDDALVDERVGYYVGVNNLLGLIGAFGAQGLADETALLARLRHALAAAARAYDPTPRVVELLLDAPTLRCKANHLTCVDGRDELVGSVETQSVYVEIPNPLAEVRP
ncbi:IucA/IucC family protein [Carbonactinospora thermoautotrophica]|uniref:IucA/IucC family protein n=1 Tax=Carbonactinospora thermoautotrophica TaxID=1469144 RepID=UPI00226FF828|nr:IucA/IucC family protein [Carbonactinospora thermoautotrophica]